MWTPILAGLAAAVLVLAAFALLVVIAKVGIDLFTGRRWFK